MSLGNFLQGVLVFAFLLLQAWLLFFYTSLALRENILRVHGSDIRPWYILLTSAYDLSYIYLCFVAL